MRQHKKNNSVTPTGIATTHAEEMSYNEEMRAPGYLMFLKYKRDSTKIRGFADGRQH